MELFYNFLTRRPLKTVFIAASLLFNAAYPLGTPGMDYSPDRNFKKKLLKTMIVSDYAPYSLTNKKDLPDGFSVDLLRAVTKEMGMDIEIEFGTWDKAVESLKNGEIDLLPMMAYSIERDKYYDFSVPHTIGYDAFFTRKNEIKIKSMKDIESKKIIVMKGDQAHDYLQSTGFVRRDQLILINNPYDALMLLKSGAGDAVILPKLVGINIIRKYMIEGIEPSSFVIDAYSRPFCVAVREGNLALLEKLNQGLNIIKTSTRYNAIYGKWFEILEPPGMPYERVLKYIMVIIVSFMALGSLLLIWLISLKKQVEVRTQSLKVEVEERKITEEKIKTALEEKDILLKELYHRTGNSMQVIRSMVALKAMDLKDEKINDFAREINNKILSMALVHEKLYQNKDLSRINLSCYLKDLSNIIMGNYTIKPEKIIVNTDMEDILVLIDAAMPLGLIFSELISNAIKYAFPGGMTGIITIGLHRIEDDAIELTFSDNGAGVDGGFDFRSRKSLGIQTIYLLGEVQLKGEVNFTARNGICCTIVFRDNLYRARV